MSKHSKYEYVCPECKFLSVFGNPVERYLCAKCRCIIQHRMSCGFCGWELSEGAVHSNCCDHQAYWEKVGDADMPSKNTYNMTKTRKPTVRGKLECSIADLEGKARMLIADEQAKLLPDNALISVLCDTVRLCRECVEYRAKREAHND